MAVKVLLREDVSGLGKIGDVVSVADGYARNYLLPRRVAVSPSGANIKALELEKKRRAVRELDRVKDLKELAERIGTIDITLRERVADDDKLYGAVSAKEVADALLEEEINVDAEMVCIDEPIKSLGVHRVDVRLHPEVTAQLKVWVVELKEGDSKPADG